ncbi:MAG TPA: OmpA family protein [Polyangiaceae bacterium]|nr:OmpA family protein [Polyangiaceae bacterium]
MKTYKILLPLVAVAAVGLAGMGAAGCHAEGHAQIGGAQTPPPAPPAPPAPPPPASTTAEAPAPPPPPPAPPKRVVALKGVQMKSATQIDMPGDIEFQKASAKIVMNDKTKKVLTQLAAILKDNPEITKLSIEGNTDNEGESKGFDNVKLSQQRAQSVVEWLTKQGVDTKRLAAIGNGSKNPLAANDTPEHMAENRRVEFHVREFNGQSVPPEEGAGAQAAAATPAGATPAASSGPASAGAAPAASATDAAKKPAKKDAKEKDKEKDSKPK